ncbi:PREDICTED: protein NUCLEAR FUSION DEFECTIVE 6, chloroplastic/mitochondrial isoform X1 [Theobroma cacao]|uniref:Protein NUCLEAR FUSION DEFECTIVE 6, chloroplastic/mitochondrial isoform X1 n=1 Tax=Theobroma cacao TaxID=3641 RepID=A0AB32VKI2_THECC|nr:PREDICTED: protein NUCLEAR FUSION DEFECTIVE 6, chloroplastic/mitochondrial isoform X1 [Theobroma cacao]
MAASCGRRTLQFSCASAKTILTHSTSSRSANNKLAGLFSPKPTSASRFSLRNLISSRLPVELGGAVTLMPLHSATASALFTSLLSLHNQSWGCLSEGIFWLLKLLHSCGTLPGEAIWVDHY